MSNPSFQVLVVTLNQHDLSLPEKMNLQSDALIGNQGMPDESTYAAEYKDHRITVYSRSDRGVGINRNNLLARADADIILLADDDVVYDNGYPETVLRAFEEHPEADGIFFDVIPIPDTIDPSLNKTWHRIRFFNCLKYGAPRLALRNSVLKEKKISFSTLFGGGAQYSSGEDSLFIADCLRSGMRLYACPERIGSVTFDTTWFKGYDEKYFKDKGVFFYFLSNRFSRILCLQYCVRKNKLFAGEYSPLEAYRLMLKGISEYKEGAANE